MITCGRISDPAPPGSCGRRFEDFDVRIVEDAGAECPPDAAGEITARALRLNIMFAGYGKRPEATAAATRHQWFHTGDIGRIDGGGFLTLVGRKKDYLRRGGESISSFELESAFRRHPSIEDVAVHAVPSDLTEEEVKVTAVLKPNAQLSEEDLCRWSLEQVPAYTLPRIVEFRDTLPRTATGRVQKHQLRGEGVTSRTWGRQASSIAPRRTRVHNQMQ